MITVKKKTFFSSHHYIFMAFCLTILLIVSWFFISKTDSNPVSRLYPLFSSYWTMTPDEFTHAGVSPADLNLTRLYFNGTEKLTKGFKIGSVQKHNTGVLDYQNTPPYNISPVYIKASQREGFKLKDFPCEINNKDRDLLFHTFQRWVKYADHRKLYWWLTFGSLLSSVRNADMNPWDTDADIAMPQNFKKLIKKDQDTQAKFGIKVVTRPSVHCIFSDGDRRSCEGKKVNKMVDVCAFCGPYGRIFLSDGKNRISSTYIDLFIVELYEDGTAFDEGLQDYTTDVVLRPFSRYFPLKLCTFMGLHLPCPNEHERILSDMYSAQYIQSKYVCDVNTTTWIKP